MVENGSEARRHLSDFQDPPREQTFSSRTTGELAPTKLPHTRAGESTGNSAIHASRRLQIQRGFSAETPGLSLLWLPHTPTVHLAAVFSISKDFRQQQTTSKGKDTDIRWKLQLGGKNKLRRGS